MIAPRRFVPLLCLLAAGTLLAQVPPPADQPSPLSSATPAPVFADERTARLAGRYETMLASNPAEGLALDRLWKMYDDAGATGRLVEEYRRACADARADPASCLVYGHLLKKAGRLDDAAAAYDRAAALDPDGPLPAFARAELALERSHPEQAAGFFETALARLSANDHRRAEWLLKTGDAWQAAGQPLKAADAWEKTVLLAPGDLAMHHRLADNYEKNGLSDRAIGHYEFIEAHADPAGRAGAWREIGRLYEARGEFDPARDALERGLALTSRDNWLYGDLQSRLIRLYQRAGRVPELEARWRAAVGQAPRDLGGYLRLELLAQAQGDPAAERVWLEKIVALSPRDRESALKLARLLADDGQHEEAAALYDKLLAAQPGSLDLILARAELDLQMGRPDAAAARIEARLAQNPADESVATPALEFFLSHHLDDASERCLRAQVDRDPDAAEPSLALGKFLFSRRRSDDARRVLDALTTRPGDAAARAARWMAVADTYKDENLPGDALRAWNEAATLQPRVAAPLLASSDLLLARGNAQGAVEPLERAMTLLPAGPEEIEVEHKLFQTLQAAAPNAVAKPVEESGWTRTIPRRPSLSSPFEITLGGPRTAADPAPPDPHADEPLGKYIASLQQVAADQPTPDHFMRLARWLSWAGNAKDAAGAAEKVIDLDQKNVPARDLLVSCAAELHQRDRGEQRLREIMALDPSRQTDCLRQIAALKTEDNNLDDALAIYDQIQKAAPGSVEALSDLAQVQQRADHWYDALATWERAYALPGLTPTQRADLRPPLLAVYERLGQYPRAAGMLQAAVDAQTDLTARESMFGELAAFCRKHDLGDWLNKQYQTRLTAQPNDYFTLTALAELSKDAGRDREAYRLLERAYYSSPDPASSLRGLADAAEALGENEEAISLQRRLTVFPGQATAENLEKLADLQNADLDADAAAQTWERITAKFPRDPASLERAAEFFENSGKMGRARELLRQVVALDTSNPRRLFHLARLDGDAGDTSDARDLYEQLLARTDAEKPGDPLLPPAELDFPSAGLPGVILGSGGRRLRVSGVAAPTVPAAEEEDERHLRLDSIRELARLLDSGGSGAARQKWLERWRAAAAAGARSEPLAAYYYAGEKQSTMNLAAGWLEGQPNDERLRNTFLAAGLRLDEYRTLAQWAWHDTDPARRAERGQWLSGALEEYLNGGGKPGPGLVVDLFPADVKMRDLLWEMASGAFADHHWYAQAAELGTRVYALTPSNRSEYALKIAQWELFVGNTGHARAILRDAVEADRAESFEPGANPVFAALRAYALLLTEEERAAFAEDYPRRMRAAAEPVHATLASVLLHGLTGNERAAEQGLDELIALRLLSTTSGGSTPDARRWGYLLNNGTQLLAWNLEALAAYCWRHALKEASAFERQDGDVLNFQAEIRTRLLGVDVALASDPQQARERVNDYLRTSASGEATAAAAAQMLGASQFPAAARLYEAACQTRPDDGENWRELFIAYESEGDRATLERVLTRLATLPESPGGLVRTDLMIRLANLRQAEGDGVGACRLLEHAHQAMPGALPILLQLAPMEERTGRLAEAERLWTEASPLDPAGGARLSLAGVEEKLGRHDEAVAIYRDLMHSSPEPTRTNAAVHLASLYVAGHRAADARVLCDQLLQDGPAAALPAVAGTLAEGGQQAFTRELLATAVRRAHDPHLRYAAQQALVLEYSAAGDDPAIFAREMRRLDNFSRSDVGMHNAFTRTRYELAHRRGADAWLETELTREWDGSRGDLAAGESLVSLCLATHREDDLREVITAIDNHPDLPEQMLRALEESLVETQHGALALPMLERLCHRFPQNEVYVQDHARALWQAGRREDAGGILDLLDAWAVFEDDLVGESGAIYLELGDKAKARQKLDAVVRSDGLAVHFPRVALQLARLDLGEGRLPEAHRLLRLAYRNPTCADLAPLVDYLAATGQLSAEASHPTLPGGDAPLSFLRRAQLLATVCERLIAAGQPRDARRWVEAHPEFLAGAPELVSTLRQTMTPTDLPAFAALVENTVSQTDPPVPPLERALGALYVQWAEQDTDPAGALNHLARARELDPDNFDVAQRLATLCLAQKQGDRAAAALAAFLGPEALPDDRARAEQTLNKLPGKTVPADKEG